MAARIGQPLMGWQQLVADVGGELDVDSGRPAYRKVVVTVPRQNGKTTLILAWELQRARGWDLHGPQVITYSAQNGSAARKKLVNDWRPILLGHKKALGVVAVKRGAGAEAVEFVNGSRIVVLSNSDDAGHGLTVDLGIVDEFWRDRDNRRDQALQPSMMTRPFGQTLVTSTAGDDESVPLNRLVARGRAAVEQGVDNGIAFFEWSAGLDDDPDDPATWWSCMPALGTTVEESAVANSRASMDDGEFRRAFLNQPTIAQDRVIPVAAWDAVLSNDAKPTVDVTFAVDVNPERSAASIAVASGGSFPVAQLIEHQPGVGWVVDRVVALAQRWGNATVVVDAAGPAAAIVPQLVAAGVDVRSIAGRELAAACGSFYDRVNEGRIVLRRSIPLDAAAAGASKRQTGDAWAWARKHVSVDVSPLVAVTLAVWGAGKAPEPPSEFFTI